ncbi:alpha/beta-hydrolase [Multifurca ochricompacta]|uniref:Carboxylic ester hydrolase n=1 Tax=Multifurca ochricompacta TaxID=376703 RepID=A0AAD4M8P2_9AGAM|nr:alpha/beta-hydrolase [Multifurca ochricompacta]
MVLIYLPLTFLLQLVPLTVSSPLVDLSSGTFRGLTVNGTDRWLGIPYAQPPVGSLRFKAPLPISRPAEGIQDALQFSHACPQPPSTAPISEDCLYLNVWRPQKISSAAKLPVLVWIHGGAFNLGSASDPAYDGTRIVNRSMTIGKPIIMVTINYRVNTFGFLASSHVPLHDLNSGLQDQRVALKFVQENIAKFGGDPRKVTIWGQSAGAGSVEAQILYPAPQHLFRAAIMDSLTGPFKSSPPPSTYDEPGKPFDALLNATGCSAGSAAVACLQAVPSQTLVNISNSLIVSTLNHQLWQPTIAPGSFAPVRASAKIASGDFLHVPVIVGTNQNEGTSFSTTLFGLGLSGNAEDTAFERFVRASQIDESKITQDTLEEILGYYPANTKQLLFSTGDSLFDRAAAWYGDSMFLATRRRFTAAAARVQPVFTYFFTEFIPDDSPKLGAQALFGPVPASGVELDFANTMLDFYVNFVNDLNPGAPWPRYTPDSALVLQLGRNNITTILDNFRQNFTHFLNKPELLKEWEK